MKKLLTILISGIILNGCNSGGSALSNNLSQPVNNSQINKVTTLDIAVHDNLNYVTDGAQKKIFGFLYLVIIQVFYEQKPLQPQNQFQERMTGSLFQYFLRHIYIIHILVHISLIIKEKMLF